MAEQRARFLIDKEVQGALMRRVLIHWCIFFILSLIALFGIEYVVAVPGASFPELAAAIWSKYAFFILLMLAIVPTFVYDTVKLSHKFVGPILRLKQSIRTLAEGAPVRELRFREGDFWRELSDDFNRVAARVEQAAEQPASKT